MKAGSVERINVFNVAANIDTYSCCYVYEAFSQQEDNEFKFMLYKDGCYFCVQKFQF